MLKTIVRHSPRLTVEGWVKNRPQVNLRFVCG